MSQEHFCYFCDEPCQTFVTDCVSRKKVPVCEPCFKEKVYPSKKNLERVEFYRSIFPLVEKA